jgi:hypothetical protein
VSPPGAGPPSRLAGFKPEPVLPRPRSRATPLFYIHYCNLATIQNRRGTAILGSRGQQQGAEGTKAKLFAAARCPRVASAAVTDGPGPGWRQLAALASWAAAPMTACPEAMAAMAAVSAASTSAARSVGTAAGRRPRVLIHSLSLQGVEDCWLAPARALQDRTDQPLPHNLKADDFRGKSLSTSAFEPIASAGEPKWQDREGAAGVPVHNPVQPLLYGIAGAAGLSLLRLNATARHRALLRRHSPHELALAAVGLSLRLGVQPHLPPHLLHVVQEQDGH